MTHSKKTSKALLITTITLSVTLHAVGIYVLFDSPFAFLTPSFSPISAVMSPGKKALAKENSQPPIETFNQLIHFRRQHLPLFEPLINIATNLRIEPPCLQLHTSDSSTLEEKFIISNQVEQPRPHLTTLLPITGPPPRMIHSFFSKLTAKTPIFQKMIVNHSLQFLNPSPKLESTTTLTSPEKLTLDNVPSYKGTGAPINVKTLPFSDLMYMLSHKHVQSPLYFPKASFSIQDDVRKIQLLDHQVVITIPLGNNPLIAKIIPYMLYPLKDQSLSEQADPIFVENHYIRTNYNQIKIHPKEENFAFDSTPLSIEPLAPTLNYPEYTSESTLNINQINPMIQPLHHHETFLEKPSLRSCSNSTRLIDRVSPQYSEMPQFHIAAADNPAITPNKESVAKLEQLTPAIHEEQYIAVPSVNNPTMISLGILPNSFALKDLEKESINKHQFDTNIDESLLTKIGHPSQKIEIPSLIINHCAAIVPNPIMEMENRLFEPTSLEEVYAIAKKPQELLAKKTFTSRAKSESLNINNTPQSLYKDPHLKHHIAREQITSTVNQEQRIISANLVKASNLLYKNLPVIYKDAFNTQLKIAPSVDGKNYLFSLALTPNKTLNFTPINQEITFIIDRSGTIQKHRYNTFRKGVIKALASLKEGDQFNIVLVDSQITKMSPNAVTWNNNALKTAAAFLNQEEYSGYFNHYNPFKVFETLIEERSSLPQTFVYLSDGASLSNIHKNRQSLAMLMQEDCSLFTAASSHANNLPMLDLIASMNKGELMHSPTHAAFPRKLSRFMKHIDQIIAKEIHINILTPDTDNHVEILPNESHLPDFYLDRPYIVYGMVDNLSDFNLQIQGEINGQIFSVNQRISFEEAQKTGSQLQKSYSTKQAQVCYEYYLKDSNPFYLKEAQKILEPFNIDIPIKL